MIKVSFWLSRQIPSIHFPVLRIASASPPLFFSFYSSLLICSSWGGGGIILIKTSFERQKEEHLLWNTDPLEAGDGSWLWQSPLHHSGVWHLWQQAGQTAWICCLHCIHPCASSCYHTISLLQSSCNLLKVIWAPCSETTCQIFKKRIIITSHFLFIFHLGEK